jgi:transposase
MKLDSINISEIVEKTKTQLKDYITITPSLKMSLEPILMVAERLGLHSKNSSIPPSKDPNRKKEPKEKGDKAAGGQKGVLSQTQIPSP